MDFYRWIIMMIKGEVNDLKSQNWQVTYLMSETSILVLLHSVSSRDITHETSHVPVISYSNRNLEKGLVAD